MDIDTPLDGFPVAARPESRLAPHLLKLAPSFHKKIWGGQNLNRMFPNLVNGEKNVGEVWGLCGDLAVSNGRCAGRSLHELMAPNDISVTCPRSILGSPSAFPLLAKFIDAREILSVQVHPDDEMARRIEGATNGKCEMSVVLHADPGAYIIHGVTRQLSREELIGTAQDGTIADLLERVPVHAGDVIMTPPGTIHALGGGCVVYEIQQPSDITYRLFDWNRVDPSGTGRELHLERAAEAATLWPTSTHQLKPVAVPMIGGTRTILGACNHYVAERLEIEGATVAVTMDGTTFHALTLLEGAAQIQSDIDGDEPITVVAGDSIVVPATTARYVIRKVSGPCKIVNAYLPDSTMAISAYLEAIGVPACSVDGVIGHQP